MQTCIIYLHFYLFISGGGDHIINLEDHLHHLRCQQQLLLLANEGLKHLLLAHVVGSRIQAVHAKIRVSFLPGKKLRTRTCISYSDNV